MSKEPEAVRESYGLNRFGQSCLLARRLIEAGVRFVTVNMFETVFDEITWDIHGSKPFSPISCYRDLVGPMFDNGLQLAARRSAGPRGCWTTRWSWRWANSAARRRSIRPAGATIGRSAGPSSMAGGGIKGGQVIGASDEIGGAPKDRPTSPGEVAATIYKALGVPLELELPGAQGRPIPLVERGVEPINELLRVNGHAQISILRSWLAAACFPPPGISTILPRPSNSPAPKRATNCWSKPT